MATEPTPRTDTGSPPANGHAAAAPREASGETRHAREVRIHEAAALQYGARYDPPFARLYQAHWNAALMKLLPEEGDAALDLGCGTGVMLPALLERFSRVAGVDLSPDMIRAVPAPVAERAELAVAPMERIPFDDNTFDAVVCRGALHHAADLSAALREIRRVLRPGGRLLLSEPCADSFLLRIPRARWRHDSDHFDEAHLALHLRETSNLLQESGFDVDKRRKFGFLAFPLCGLSDLLPLLRKLPAGAATAITRGLILVDAACARIPLIRHESWHMILRARSTR